MEVLHRICLFTSLWLPRLFDKRYRIDAIGELLFVTSLYALQLYLRLLILTWFICLAFFVGTFFYALRELLGRFASDSIGPGTDRPVFIRCWTHHMRFFPQLHAFTYFYLMVGIPLGFQGSIGRLFSVPIHGGTQGNKQTLFSVDSRDFLERGDESLEEKLRTYLQKKDVNLDDFPAVYLVTAPRFLGYQFNPVSFWYLYDKTLSLSLVLLEVNNTFVERHVYFLRPTEPSSPSFSQHFDKELHVSPFNDLTGFYRASTRDPFRTSSTACSEDLLFMNIELFSAATLETSERRKKLTGMVRSIAPPIDIHKLSRSPTSTAHFVMTDWWIGLITFPRIIFQAAQLAMKKLQVYWTPTIFPGDISRTASALEVRLESYFRGYIQQRVSEYPGPIVLRYSSAGTKPERRTFSNIDTAPLDIPMEIDLIVLNPQFYLSWAMHDSLLYTLTAEMNQVSKGGRKTIEVTNDEGLISLLDRSAKHQNNGGPLWWFVSKVQEWSKPKFGVAATIPPKYDAPIAVDMREYKLCVAYALVLGTLGRYPAMLDPVLRASLLCITIWGGKKDAILSILFLISYALMKQFSLTYPRCPK